MPIIVNSTTIPTNEGNIKVGSTNVTKVNVVSGSTTTTVWEATRAYYAYQNGAENSSKGILQPSVTSQTTSGSGSYGTATIAVKNSGLGLYVTNIWTHEEDDEVNITARSPKLPVNGNTTLAVDYVMGYTDGSGILTPEFKIYGVSSSGAETLLYNVSTYSGSKTLTVSSYSYIILQFTMNASYGSNGCNGRQVWSGVKNARFYS